MRERVKQRQSTNPEQFGFRSDYAGAHTARTIMVPELEMLLNTISSEDSSYQQYAKAVLQDNCLHKRSAKNRERTLDNLRILYGLDDRITIFRVLKKVWRKEPESLPQIAFLCATSRDLLLRELTPWILSMPEGSHVSRLNLEEHITQLYPDRFSSGTLTSTCQNLNASWTQVGFLQGRSKKLRIKTPPTPASATYALLLGFLYGTQGMGLFETVYSTFLDCPKESLITMAETASKRGLLRMKRIGDVVEIAFDTLLMDAELEKLNVQA